MNNNNTKIKILSKNNSLSEIKVNNKLREKYLLKLEGIKEQALNNIPKIKNKMLIEKIFNKDIYYKRSYKIFDQNLQKPFDFSPQILYAKLKLPIIKKRFKINEYSFNNKNLNNKFLDGLYKINRKGKPIEKLSENYNEPLIKNSYMYKMNKKLARLKSKNSEDVSMELNFTKNIDSISSKTGWSKLTTNGEQYNKLNAKDKDKDKEKNKEKI